MNKKFFHKLLAEIGGGQPVGEEAEDARRKAEEEVLASLHNQYGGCLLFGDAVHQFYSDMLRDIEGRLLNIQETPILQFFFQWHALSASRFFAAFDLFRRGYGFESATLARTLWETALTMCALQQKILSLEKLFGGTAEAGKVISSREVVARVRQVDRCIQNNLLWENPALDQSAREALETFLFLMNQATHKSTLGLSRNNMLASRWRAAPLFPKFEQLEVEASWNILFLATWCLMRTLSYLEQLLPGPQTQLRRRYESLMVVFEELYKSPPNSVVKDFGEVVHKVFVLNS